jgi:hypothetical protein
LAGSSERSRPGLVAVLDQNHGHPAGYRLSLSAEKAIR